MPLARVAIQPPNVENSIESGSMPMVTPCFANAFFSATPVMPASMCATPSSAFTHNTFDNPRMSSATKGLGSSALPGHCVAEVTFVRPPTGITAKPPASSPAAAAAACSTARTSPSEDGCTTASGMRRSASRVRSLQMSARPWPVPARSRASASHTTRSAGTAASNCFLRSSGSWGTSGRGCSGSVSRTFMDTASSRWKNAQSW
mmetsp:Transcript_5352/g.14772  ORF Transcript_5352/g.14772 Transcript_5352/m.14772 type:complete len:204 (-) Transcript_5352:2302-2913(-)